MKLRTESYECRFLPPHAYLLSYRILYFKYFTVIKFVELKILKIIKNIGTY
jgi:hypothetical protein